MTNNQIELIEQLLSWSGFPCYIGKLLLKNICKKGSGKKTTLSMSNIPTIWSTYNKIEVEVRIR